MSTPYLDALVVGGHRGVEALHRPSVELVAYLMQGRVVMVMGSINEPSVSQ